MPIQKIVKQKLFCTVGLLIFTALLLCCFFGFPMREFISILAWGEIIEYSKATMLAVFGSPVLLIMIIHILRALFHKGDTILPFSEKFSFVASIIAVVSLALGFVGMLIFWIAIAIAIAIAFSDYTRCDLPGTKAATYFVKDPAICQTIRSKGLWGE